MPEGFADIRLGMTIAELKKVRKNLVPDDPMDGGRKWSSGYARLISFDENAQNPFFGNATYTFNGGRLSGVDWQTFVPDKILQPTLKSFLPSVLKLYGRPSLLKLATDGSSKRAVVIIWRKQGTLVYAQLTPEARFYRPSADRPRADRGYIVLSIKTGTPTDLASFINNRAMFPPSNKAQVNKYLVPIQKEILQQLPSSQVVPIAASSVTNSD